MKLLNQDYKSHAFSLPKLFESFDGKTFKNHASEGAYLLESPTCLRGSWRSNSGDEILKATKELFRLKSDRGGILNKGPLFDKLNEQTGGRLTLIPDFFLDTHYEYFFD
jgi:hypothetical protein